MRLEISSLAGSAGAAFYRAESAQARDLAVLAAAVLKQEGNRLRVFEVLAGCGIRSKRYLQQVQGTARFSARHPECCPSQPLLDVKNVQAAVVPIEDQLQ